MAKVYLICGKICSGKTYYAKKLQKEVNAVYLSLDEASYELITNMQGEFYNIFCARMKKYLLTKSVEIVKANANVIYEGGLWTKKERSNIINYLKDNNVDVELHYVNIDDKKWYQQINARNNKIENNQGGYDFYIDEGLMNKFLRMWEEVAEDEIDVIYDRK